MAKLSMPGSLNVAKKHNDEVKGKGFKNAGKAGTAGKLK